MATGAPGTNGVWQYGEDDSEATFSALLNKAASTTDTQFGADRARLTTLEAKPTAGLIPVAPTSVDKSGGTATTNALGQVTFTNVASISLNSVFNVSNSKKYKIIFEATGSTGPIETLYRWRTSGVDKVINYYGGTTWTTYNSGPSAVGQRNNGSNGFIVPIRTSVASQATLEVLTKSDNWNYTSLIYSPHYSAGGSGGYECPITTADGFTILTASGTMTGTVQVFAYND